MNKFIHGNNMSGQSIVDRALAARHTVAGQSLAKVICKATTEELMGPKRKHLDYLIQCTNEPNISIPQMANLLIDRTQNSSWVVVFKALVTVHNLMNYGNERFTQFLASNHCSFHLSNFHDNTNNQSYEMSSYIRRHSKYLNEKAVSYRQMAVDFCKVKRGKEDGLLRTMDTDKLLKSLPVLQVQLDSLVEFNASSRDLSNGIINSAFLLLFKDLIRLFACYNDGIINLLEKYFDMNKKNCKEALEIYKRFLARMDRVCEVLKVAENIGIDKGDIPDLAKAPSSLLEALEQHLSYMENNKKVVSNKPTAGLTAVINNYAAASQAGNALGAGADEITEEERKKILDEEQRQLDLLKKERMKQMSPAASSTSSNTSGKAVDPFAPSSTPTTTTTTTSTTKIATASTAAATTAAITTSSHITDLLSLNNTPPALFSSPQQQQQQQDLFSQQEFFSQQPPQQQDLFSQQPSQQLSFFPQQQQQSQQLFTQQNLFGAPNTFQTAFPTSQPQQQQPQQFSPQQQQNLPLNPFLPQQQPLFNFQQQQQQQSWLPPSKQQNDTFNNAFNPIQQQQQQQQQPPPSTNIMPPPMQPPSTTLNMQAPPSSTTTTPKHPTKLIHSDLDSSLASLAGSLSFSPVGQLKKVEHQWTGGGPERKMTGANHGNNQWGFNAASTTTNNAWATPYSTSMAAQRNANMSPFQVNQPRPMTQSAGGVWGSTPHLQSANQVSKPTSLDQSNNPFGLL